MQLRRRELLIGLSVAALSLRLPAVAWAASPAAFSLIAPDAAARLRDAVAPTVRRSVMRAADRALDREPHAMARVHVEGTLPGHGIYDESREALRDLPMIRDLAVAAALGGEAQYGAAAVRLMEAWLSVYRPGFNPIDETGFDALFVAFDVLPAPARDRLSEPMQSFLREMASGYLDRMGSLKGSTATNNWQSHRVKLAALAAFGTGDRDLIARARDAFAAQIAANIAADGTTLDFRERDALHYVVYDLEPLTLTALAAAAHGADWYGIVAPSGGSLARALDWLVPYANGSAPHEEFVHTTVQFDRDRHAAGVPGFAGPFGPKAARMLFATAARLDPKYATLAAALAGGPVWLDAVLPIGSSVKFPQ